MLQYIDDVIQPKIGSVYLVRCVKVIKPYLYYYSKPIKCYVPILHEKKHIDKGSYETSSIITEIPHIHIDVRFLNKYHCEKLGITKHYEKNYYLALKSKCWSLQPIVLWEEMLEEDNYKYFQLRMKRQVSYVQDKIVYKIIRHQNLGKKVINNKCPHHGYDLKNIQEICGVKVCPLHGLNIKDGVVI